MRERLKVEAEKLKINHFWIQYLTGSEFACIYYYLWVLRHLEYYKSKGRFFYILYLVFYIWHRKLRVKFNIHLGPGDAAKGIHIVHLGFVRCYGIAKLGENCTILPMVLFGKRTPEVGEGYKIFVGDNCYFGTGCTVLAPCKIGNNVTVAAGAVVTQDIPDNCVVAGIPAKIVKYKCAGQ